MFTKSVFLLNEKKMFCKQCCRVTRLLNLSKSGTFLGQRRKASSRVKFFEKILDFSSPKATKVFLQKHDYLMKKDRTVVSDSFQYLREIGITTQGIRDQPKILCSERTVLQNRHEILTECGSSNVNVYTLNKYLSICKENEEYLKYVGIIDNNVDLQQRLANRLNVKFQPCKEDASLTTVRMHFLRLFCLENDFMTAEEFNVAIRDNSIRHTSFQRMTKILTILTEQLNIPRDKISDYIQTLKADPDNLQQLLKIKPIGDVSIRDILLIQPDLMLRSVDSVKRTLKQLKAFGISDESIKNCCNVLKLDPIVVRSRLQEMKHDVKTLDFHPNVLNLLVHSLKVQSRLDHLKALGRTCFNMTALTASPQYFQRFTERESDINQPRDCALFLAKNLEMEPEEARIQISRHPYWSGIPFVEMKETIDALKHAGFELEAIRASIHIVLYSRDVIVKRLQKLGESELFEDYRWTDLPQRLQLKLVLYEIEAEKHFSGDGVWLDRKSKFD